MGNLYVNQSNATIYYDNSAIYKIYIGDIEIYGTTTTAPPSVFDYVYYVINLKYIPSIKNDIYDLHYDLL